MGLFDWIKKDKDHVEETSSIQSEEERENTEEYKENVMEPDTQEESIPSPEDNDILGRNEPEEEMAEDDDISEADEHQEGALEAEEDDVPVSEEEGEETSDSKKKGFFGRLVSGLTKTRNSIADSFSSVFAANHIDEDFYEELEEILIMADMGVSTTMNILDELRDEVKKQHIKEPKDCQELLVSIIKNQMSLEENAYDYEQQKSVVMVIGVNGVGKTTSIGKLASQFRKNGKKVMMAAADTFRAAAIEQLTEWANRSQVDIISQKEGADPSAVVFDALKAAKARKTDILLIDTAGRLHNKKNLMDELSKMNRIIDREYPDACRETLIVLDGTTGQNALEQAKQFKQVADIDGIILTKLDGTAKGGIAIAIHAELGVPVKYIGVGEGIDDLQKFDPESYVNAIFAKEEDVEEE